MDPRQFDALTRSLGAARSRRSMLKTFGTAALGAMGLAGANRPAAAAPGGNSACAHFCQQLPPGPQRGQCVSDAAHGTGLCYQCGPAAPPTGLTLCGTVCVDTTSDPTNCGGCGTVCPAGEVCTSGTCVACLGNNQTCAATTDTCCTAGYVCGNDFCGQPFACCGNVGAACTDNCDCCGFNVFCIGGTCSQVCGTGGC